MFPVYYGVYSDLPLLAPVNCASIFAAMPDADNDDELSIDPVTKNIGP